MDSRWLWAVLFAVAAGCPMTVTEEVYPPVSDNLPAVEAERPIAYEQFLVLMDGAQRQAFFELRTTSAKGRFLQEHGLTVKRMLADNLRLGMSASEVESILGRPPQETAEQSGVSEAGRYRRLVDEWWVYQRPDTGNLVFIPFRRGWVVDWLLEPEIRKIVYDRPSDEAGRKKKEASLIHLGEHAKSLLRRPEETREEYVERMRADPPILFSKGPPSWPEKLPGRDQAPDFGKTKISKEDVYSCWGNTAKLYEAPEADRPATYYSTSQRWTYKVFNDFGFTYYSLLFLDNRLAEWEVETDIAR